MFIFLVLVVIAIVAIVIIATNNSTRNTDSDSTPDYFEQSSISDREPRISATVSEDLYNSVQEYCQNNSMTISALIRKAVEAYIDSHSSSSSITFSTSATSRPSTKRNSDSWKCPKCGKLNANYVGTCACGGTKDSPPKKAPKRPSYIRKDGSWKCPKCGTVNAAYVGSCSCGQNKE